MLTPAGMLSPCDVPSLNSYIDPKIVDIQTSKISEKYEGFIDTLKREVICRNEENKDLKL
jgi:hypothetical protein